MNNVENTLDGLRHLIECNIDNLLYSDKYKVVLSRHNNLIEYDVLNRIAIACQNSKAVVLKTAEEWDLAGRAINPNAKPVYIFNPQYKVEYIDTSNGESLEKTDLTPEEKIVAMRLGMVEKQHNVNDISVMKTFELYDTYSLTGEDYKINKPFLSMKEITEIFKNITSAKVLPTSGKMHYNEETNTLYMDSSSSYINFIDSISLIWSKWLIKNKILEDNEYSYDINTSDFSDKEIDKLERDLAFAINILFGGSLDINVWENIDIHKDKLLGILYIIDILMNEVLYRTKFTSEAFNEDATHRVYKLKKTERIISSMFTAYIQNL